MTFINKISILVVFAAAFAGYKTIAQTSNPFINSGEVIKNGTQLHDDKKYKEAIEEYKKIDRSDTNYVNELYELSYSYSTDSQFNKSLEYAKLGLSLFPQKYSTFTMLAANSLDDMNRPEEALSLYDSALKRAPQSFLLYFNKGIVNYKLKNYDEAKNNMQRCLLINPYYSSAHYFLGSIYLLEGRLVPAMLAYKTYLLITPGGKYHINVINSLSDIAKVTDEVLDYVKQKKPNNKEDNFSIQQDILLSKLSLDKQYKLKADLEDNIVRQIQVVDEKLEFNKNDKGFCMQYYVPFFIKTLKDGYFEAMIFSMFSGIENKQVDSWIKKNKKEKDVFVDMASAYFDEIQRTQSLDPSERETSLLSYVYDNNVLEGKGLYTSRGKDGQPTGKWEYYHTNGALKATGTFNNAGEKEGEWTYYHPNGKIKEKSNNVKGVLNGSTEGWFDNGNQSYKESYINGKLTGVQTIHFYNENLRTVTAFKDDLKNGAIKYYDMKGTLTSSATYADDKLEGLVKNYYADGKIKNESTYKNDKEEGIYKSYYNSGALYLQGEFKNDLRQGLWTTYYEDSIVSEKTNYLDNEITGEFTEYHENGKLSRKGTYYKKKIDGKIESFDDDGKLYSDATYDRGKLREINFYDKTGKIISTTSTRKGAANIVFYSAEGIKTSEGYFNKDGYKDGKFVTYFTSGKINEESNWKEGVQDGPEASYFPTGKIKKSTSYKNGEEDGYIKDFYASGKLSSEGWKVNGERQQGYLFYNNIGDLTTKEYYLDDELSGYTEYFDPGHILTLEYFYKSGWLLNIKQFDSTGKILSNNNLEDGHGPLIYKHPNGKTASTGSYDHYLLNGPFTYYFFDGSLSATSFYKNDQRDSIYKGYFYGGKLKLEGKFKEGKKEGKWKYYYPDGKIKEEENYVDGELEGINKIYLPDGSADKVYNYKKGKLDGAYNLYGENNQLAVRFNYKDDQIKSYQYEIKPGVLGEPVILKGGTGDIAAKYPNGKTSVTMQFIDNEVYGERKVYFSNGKIYIDGNRQDGYNNGPFKIYFPTGALWQEENYVLGNLHGSCKYYYPNGKLEKEENYYNDDKHGICKYYDEQGKLKQTQVYNYGSLLGVK